MSPTLRAVPPLLRASHFPPTLLVTSVTTALAVATGRGWSAAWVAAAVLAGQFSVGWSNDYLDRELDRDLDRQEKPLVNGTLSPRVLRTAAGVAVVSAAALSFASGGRAALAHTGAIALAWSYNLGLKRTAFSVVPYAVAFALLPTFVTLGANGHPAPPAWALAAGALLGAGAHFTNTLPDLAGDLRTGVRGLPHRIGPRGSVVIAAAFLAGAATLLALGPDGKRGPAVVLAWTTSLVAVAGVAIAGLTGREKLAWPLTLATAGISVALLLARGAALT